MPGRENAYVDGSKVTDYLLATTHPDGWSKAEFFRRFGFTVQNDNLLIAALVEIARDNEVVEVVESAFGTRQCYWRFVAGFRRQKADSSNDMDY